MERTEKPASPAGVFITLIATFMLVTYAEASRVLSAEADRLALFGIVLSVATLGVVIYQVWLMHTQVRLMETQDKILNRREHLTLQYETSFGVVADVCEYEIPQDWNGDISFSVRIHNDGDRAASGYVLFYYFVMSPDGISLMQPGYRSEPAIINGVEHHRQDVFAVAHPVYAGSSDTIDMAMRVHGGLGTYKFLWRISSDSGVFPGKDEYGEFRVIAYNAPPKPVLPASSCPPS